jgi:hypothetical protein
MSLTAQIASSDSSFKLSQKLVSSLAEKFGFKFEDGWAVVSSRSVENVQKRLKREKKRSNPASQVKHPRTAFSFFTQKQRPIETSAHPDATFGQLSGFVATAWKNLSATDLQKYKDMEIADKARYQTERTAALAVAPAVSNEAVPATPTVVDPTEPKAKKASKAKAVATEAPAPAPVASAPVAPAKASKASKTPKATPVDVAPVVATPAKASKAKATPAPAPAPAPAPDAVAPVAEVAPAKASTPAKSKKAGKQ